MLLFSFTQEAARIVEPGWTMNPVGNWWFILSIVFLFTPTIWFVTDRIIEPRLGAWGKEPDAEIQAELAKSEITAQERRGLRNAGLAALVIIGLFAALTLLPGYSPLLDETKEGTAQMQPFYSALVAGFFFLFVGTGMAFGLGAGTVKSSSDALGAAVRQRRVEISDRRCEAGELLKLGLPESVILKAAALIYLMPLFGLFVGAALGQFLGQLLEFNPNLGAMGFAAVGALIAWSFGKQQAKRLEVDAQPVILAYLGRSINLNELAQ